MLKIHRLQLKLPEGYEDRATRIIRLVSEELELFPLNRNLEIETMTVPCVEIGQNLTDQQVARKIASSIYNSLSREDG